MTSHCYRQTYFTAQQRKSSINKDDISGSHLTWSGCKQTCVLVLARHLTHFVLKALRWSVVQSLQTDVLLHMSFLEVINPFHKHNHSTGNMPTTFRLTSPRQVKCWKMLQFQLAKNIISLFHFLLFGYIHCDQGGWEDTQKKSIYLYICIKTKQAHNRKKSFLLLNNIHVTLCNDEMHTNKCTPTFSYSIYSLSQVSSVRFNSILYTSVDTNVRSICTTSSHSIKSEVNNTGSWEELSHYLMIYL